MKRHWLAYGVCGLLLMLLLVVLLALAGVQTRAGKDFISSRAASLLSVSPHRIVALEGLDGVLPSALRVKRIVLSDADGEWLVVEDLALSWSPLALLARKVLVHELSASRIALTRAPGGPAEKKEPEAQKTPVLPAHLPHVVVEKLSIPAFELGEKLVGKAAVFSVAGGIAPEASGLTGSLQVHRTDQGPETTLAMDAGLTGEPMELNLKASARESQDGWIATSAQLKDAGPLELSVEGRGPLSAWKGQVRLAAGKYGFLSTSVQLALTENTALSLDGQWENGEDLLPPQWLPALGRKISFALAMTASPDDSLALERLRIEGERFRVDGNAALQRVSRAVQGRVSFQVNRLEALESALGRPLSGGLSLDAGLTGSLSSPELQLFLHLKDLKTESTGVGRVQTELKVRGKDADGADGRFDLQVSGSAEGIHSLSIKDLPETTVRWSLDADVPKKGLAFLRRLEVESDRAHLEAKGKLDPQTLASELECRLNIEDLKSLAPLLGRSCSGSADLDLTMNSEENLSRAKGVLRGGVKGLAGLPAAFASLLGREVTVRSDLDVREKQFVEMPSLKVEAAGFSMEARGAMNLMDQTVSGDLKVFLPQLNVLSPLAGRDLSGSAVLSASAQGKTAGLKLLATLEGSRVALDRRSFDKVHAEIKGERFPGSPTGDLSVEIVQGGRKLSLFSGYLLEGKKLEIRNFKLDTPGGSAKSDARVDLATWLTQGSVDARLTDLGALGAMAGVKMKGSGNLALRMDDAGGKQAVALQMNGQTISGPFGSLQDLSARADVKDLLQTPRGNAELALKGLEARGTRLGTLNVSGSGDGKSVSFLANTAGKAQAAFDVKAQGALELAKEGERLTLRSLAGHYSDYPFQLQSPLTASRKGERLSVEDLRLLFGQARLQAAGGMDPGRVDFKGKINNLPMTMLAAFGGPDLSGTVDGELTLSGRPSTPQLNVTLKADGLRASNPAYKDVPAALVNADASIADGRIAGRVTVEKVLKEPARAELTLPVRFSLSPFQFQVSPESPLQGHVEARADLHSLMAYVPQEDHKLKGALSADLDLSGSIKDPQVHGEVLLENGHYENWESGTVLNDMSLRILTRGSRMEIEELKATDGHKGRVTGTGWLTVDASKNYPFEVHVTLADAVLVRRDDFTGALGGEVGLSGSARDVSLGGSLTFAPAEINIGGKTAPAVTRLEVVEISKDGESQKEAKAKEGPKSSRPPVRIAMDMDIRLPNRVFVRGVGLDSEWQGQLKVTGDTGAPAVWGNLNSVRGTFDFLDKRFKIVKGVLQFNGMVPPMPVLDLVAEAKGKDMIGRLKLSGLASSPNLLLESDPVMPQDEILARLLFGRNLSEITPVQAVKLAQAARSLSSGGTGPGFFGRARKSLGMDQLQLREGQSEGSQAAVGFGKYLTEGVYLDVQKDISGQAGKASVEVELTPSITVQGQAGSDASTGLGVNWKKDY